MCRQRSWDVEHLFDGAGLFFYFLGEVPAEAEHFTQQLAEQYETTVEFRKFAETLAEGCGPGCGTEEVIRAGRLRKLHLVRRGGCLQKMTSGKFGFDFGTSSFFRHSSLGISSFCVCPPVGVLRNPRKRFFRRKTCRLLHYLISFRPELVDVSEHCPVQNLQSFAKLAPLGLVKTPNAKSQRRSGDVHVTVTVTA